MANGDGRKLKGKRGLLIPSPSPSPSPTLLEGNSLTGSPLSPTFEKKRILGLDPGLATLGFGIIDCYIDPSKHQNHHLSLIDFGVIKTPASQEMGQRLCTIYEDVRALVSQFQPDLAVAEKLFFYRMGNTISIAQARGVLMLALAQEHLPLFEFTPAQVKQALTGYGNADKSQVQEAVARELNLDYMPKPDDAADALATALTAWFDDDIVCKD